MNALYILAGIVGALLLGLRIGYSLAHRQGGREAYRHALLIADHEWAMLMLDFASKAIMGKDPDSAKDAAQMFVEEWDKWSNLDE